MPGPGPAVAPFYSLLLSGRIDLTLQRLAAARGAAMREGQWDVVGQLSELTGEAHYIRGEYALAMDWYRQAAELVPELAEQGRNSITAILRDQGELEQAEAYGRRHLAAMAAAGDGWGLPYARLQLGMVLAARGQLGEAEAEYEQALRLAAAPDGEPFYAILAQAHLACLHGAAGDAVRYRQLGEQALSQARGRSLYLRAAVAVLISRARSAWGQPDEARALLMEAVPVLEQAGARWLLHMAHLELAREELGRGDAAGGQVLGHLAAALIPASQEGYVQFIWERRDWTMPLLAEAMRAGIEVSFCQELLVRAGPPVLPLLRALIGAAEPRARQAALYPLAAIGGETAVALVRHALYDSDPQVRDAAVLAYRHLLRAEPEAGVNGELPGGVAAPEPPEPPVQVSCLGPLTVRVHGRPVRLRTQKARDLLACLIAHRGQPLSKERLLEALWPDSDPDAIQELFHTTVYQLRRALRDAGEPVVLYSGGMYQLDRAQVRVDIDSFLALAGGRDPAGWAAAAGLYGGELFAELDYPWCEGLRAHFREQYLQLLRRLGQHEQEQGAPDRAALWWQRLIEADPLGEEAHLALVQCYVLTGRRAAAVQQYRTLVRTLQRELGVQPTPESQALVKRLLS